MAEDLKTLREAAIEIRSARTEMRVYAGCAGFIATIVIGLMVWGFNTGFEKIDRLEIVVVELNARMNNLESSMGKIAEDVAAIKRNTQTASLEPGSSPTAPNDGSYRGVITPEDSGETVPLPAIGGDNGGPVPAN